jgi:hypothetical protein
MSGCPIRPVRHIYRRNGGGPITNYSTIQGICKICPPVIPPPPPPPPGNIEFKLYSDVPYSVTFSLGNGSGTYDLGDGILIPWSASLPISITGIVPVGATVRIYSDDIQQFIITDQPVSYLNVSNCPSLKELTCNQSNLTGAFDISGNPNLTRLEFLNTPISSLTGVTSCPQLLGIFLQGAAFTQTTADQLVNDLITNENYLGTLDITAQSTGSITITGFSYIILTNTYKWTIS